MSICSSCILKCFVWVVLRYLEDVLYVEVLCCDVMYVFQCVYVCDVDGNG